jgi:hygromycin-B 4-O-kinase
VLDHSLTLAHQHRSRHDQLRLSGIAPRVVVVSGLLSLGDAERFLRERYGSRAGPVMPLGAGDWSRVFAFTLDGQDMAAKFGAHADDFAKDARMARYSSAALPIPAVHDAGAGPGGSFAVSRRAHGEFLDQLNDSGMRAALPALLAALRTARDIQMRGPDGDIPAGTRPGYGMWRPDGTAPYRTWRDALLDSITDRPGRRTHGWRHALATSPTGPGPFDDAAAALRELAPRGPQPRQLIHGDLLYRNVLVQGPAITAVLDWGNSMYGDGLYDLAWLLYWWPWFPAWREIDIRAVISDYLEATGGWPDDSAGRLRCYQIHVGLDAQAYNAFTGRWQDLADNARQTAALAAHA